MEGIADFILMIQKILTNISDDILNVRQTSWGSHDHYDQIFKV
jgi:hypothetical protein